MRYVAKQNNDGEWYVLDEGVEPHESNYYGIVAMGFDTETQARIYAARMATRTADARQTCSGK
jgi:hypothetical protein